MSTLPLSSRVLEKAKWDPSGDHASSASGPVVSRVTLLPSGFMRKIPGLPERTELNAIACPSGDQRGVKSVVPLVSGVTSLPSTRIE
jgi:hypothetical protein